MILKPTPLKITSFRISAGEYRGRMQRLANFLAKKNFTGAVLFDRDYILYYTGFAFIPTERPIAFLLNSKMDTALFVPRLELEHAESNAAVQRVDHYVEYPHSTRPESILKNLLDELGIAKNFGSDLDGYPWILGYKGPSLTELTGCSPERITDFIENQMMVKSEAEIALIKESVKWGNLAHTRLQQLTKVGRTETEVSLQASKEATLIMLDTIGPIYRSQSYFASGATAGYRGQIGRNAAIPHALANHITFQPGDVLVTGAGAVIWGYHSELERTMIVGPASDEQKVMFDHMLTAQTLAIETIQPGIPCAEVDDKVKAYYEEHHLMPFWKHHTGHAIGMRYHEAPFLDIGDQTEIKSGMVFTVEPGLYRPDLGGFRHSDTVLVTQEGVEVLTYYPRDRESLTILV
jgi:Xaa-Pro aminopeptidase